MARTSLNDIRGLVDPLQQWNFDLLIPSIPGNGASEYRNLTIKCMSTSLPGMQIDQVVVPLKGVEVNYAGRQVYTKTFTATFVETRDTGTRKAIRGWMVFARNNPQNKGNYKADYARDLEMLIYDDIPNISQQSFIRSAFPIAMDDTPLDGGNSAVVTYNVTFSYDLVEDAGGA